MLLCLSYWRAQGVLAVRSLSSKVATRRNAAPVGQRIQGASPPVEPSSGNVRDDGVWGEIADGVSGPQSRADHR